jgi:hypothetical protein
MARESSETVHTVIITDVRDETTRKRVAHSLAKVTRNISSDKIRARLNNLPWTLTRSATPKRAARLVRLLERLGAGVKVIPPLPMDLLPDVHETQILPGAHMLSETQIASSTQFISAPTETSLAPEEQPATVPPPTGRKPGSPARSRDLGTMDGVEIEPLTLGGILDRSFQICRGFFWKLFTILAIPWLITVGLALVVVLGAAAFVGFSIHSLGAASTGFMVVLGVAAILAVLVAIAVFYLAQGALIHAVSSIYLGREILIRDAYRFVFSRLLKFFLTSFLFLLALIGFTLAPIIIGAVLYFVFEQFTSGWWSAVTWLPLLLLSGYGITKLLLFDKVVIIEDTAYLGALGRSWDLISGKTDGEWPRSYFVRISLLLLIFIMLSFTISMLFQAPVFVMTLMAPQFQTVANIIGQILSNIAQVVVSVFNSVCLVVFYYDIRNRKEGFDLKMLSRMGEDASDMK